jgi:hypothetical protein
VRERNEEKKSLADKLSYASERPNLLRDTLTDRIVKNDLCIEKALRAVAMMEEAIRLLNEESWIKTVDPAPTEPEPVKEKTRLLDAVTTVITG